MKTMLTKKIFLMAVVVTAIVALGFGSQLVRAWQEPTTNAPGGNIAAPINTGGGQTIGIFMSNGYDALAVKANNQPVSNVGGSALYLQQSNGSGYAGYFSGNTAISGSSKLCLNASGLGDAVNCITHWSDITGNSQWTNVSNTRIYPNIAGDYDAGTAPNYFKITSAGDLYTKGATYLGNLTLGSFNPNSGDLSLQRNGSCLTGTTKCRALVSQSPGGNTKYMTLNYGDSSTSVDKGDFSQGVFTPGYLTVDDSVYVGWVPSIPYPPDNPTPDNTRLSVKNDTGKNAAIYAEIPSSVTDCTVAPATTCAAVYGSAKGGKNDKNIYAAYFDGDVRVTGALITQTMTATGTSQRLEAFTCGRDSSDCGTGTAATCEQKCQNATSPKSGFCTSAWEVDASDVLYASNCTATGAPKHGTVTCNCAFFATGAD